MLASKSENMSQHLSNSIDNKKGNNFNKNKTHSQHSIKSNDQWNFPVDYNDHFETPLQAYEDLNFIIELLTNDIGKEKRDVCIYDPYFCKGKMVEHLNSLGYANVINRNVNFYSDVSKRNTPGLKYITYFCYVVVIVTLLYVDFDILVTNPPYSGEHKPRLLDFLKSSGKPFAILLPVYTATKSYWKTFISPEQGSVGQSASSQSHKSVSIKPAPLVSSNAARENREVCYLLPPNEYMFYHPEGTGKETPPFYSAWFLGNMPFRTSRYISNETRFEIDSFLHNFSCRIQQLVDSRLVKDNSKKRKIEDCNNMRLCSIVSTIDELIARGLVVDKRPNPKARKRMKLKMNKDIAIKK